MSFDQGCQSIPAKALGFTASAQGNLGRMYGNGEGVLQDNLYAHMWFNVGGSNPLTPTNLSNSNHYLVTRTLFARVGLFLGASGLN